MARNFVQLGILIAVLGIIITVTNLTGQNPLLGVFVFSTPLIGAYMIWKSKDNFLERIELAMVGVASIVSGVTYILGDFTIAGFSLKVIGLTIAILVELILILRVVNLWK